MAPKIYKIYDDTNLIVETKSKEIIGKAWKDKSKLWGDCLHRICPYNAMFPVRLADFFIEKYSKIDDIVFDPFSGRGTTLLQARINSRRSYGSDLSPLAYVISRSKTKTLEKKNILNRLEELENKFIDFKKDNNAQTKGLKGYDVLNIYFSDCNLLQIFFLKTILGINWKNNDDVDNFILAISLGLMHGPAKKDGTSSFFSLSMSNGVSMSPNYVKKYSMEHNLQKPEDNLFNLLRKKINKIYSKSNVLINNYGNYSTCRYGNALDLQSLWPDLQPDLIFTSPPYLDIINYTKQNWLKMWFLGFDNIQDNKSLALNDFHNKETYLNDFLIKFMCESSKMLVKEHSKLIMVIGDVTKHNRTYSIFDDYERIEKETGLILEEVYIDNVLDINKSTQSLGTRSGKSVKSEKTYVFSLPH